MSHSAESITRENVTNSCVTGSLASSLNTDGVTKVVEETVPIDTDETVVTKPVVVVVPSDSTVPNDGFALHGIPFSLTMFALCLACFMAGLDFTIIVTAMPAISKEFGNFDEISWIIVSFMLTNTASTPLWGRFNDILGRRDAMQVALLSFVIGSILCAVATSLPLLAIFRAIQGIGGGGIFSCALIMIADLVPAHQRGAYIGPLASMFALSGVTGPLIGGAFTDSVGWRWCFWINVPIGVICSIVVHIFIPKYLGRGHLIIPKNVENKTESKIEIDNSVTDNHGETIDKDTTTSSSAAASLSSSSSTVTTNSTTKTSTTTVENHELDVGSIDYLGILFIVGFCMCFALAVTWGGSKYAWNSATIIGLLIAASIFLIIFVFIELYHAADPIIPVRLFIVRNFAVGAGLSFFSGINMLGSYVYLPIFFQQVMLQNATQSGASLIPMALSLPVGAMISGALITLRPQYGYRIYPVIGATFMIISNVLYSYFTASTPSYHLVGVLILGGLGLGPNVQVPLLAAQNAVSVKDQPTTSSTMTFFQNVGGLLGTAVMQSLLNSNLEKELQPVQVKLTMLINYLKSIGVATGSDEAGGSFDVKSLKGLPVPFDTLYDEFIHALTVGTTQVFWVGVAAGVLVFIIALFMEHIPLKGGDEDNANEEKKKIGEDGDGISIENPMKAIPKKIHISFGH
jgi:MFS family permease